MNADIADGIPFLQAIGILEFRMDDEAGLTKDFGMSQVRTTKVNKRTPTIVTNPTFASALHFIGYPLFLLEGARRG